MTEETKPTEEKVEGLPVSGFVAQSHTNIATVNVNKYLEEAVLKQLDILALQDHIDKRWLAAGRTHLEIAFMCINRSVFKPERAK